MYLFVKRCCDCFLALIGFIITLPIWIIAIIGIEINDPGPIFYVANRIGKDNKQFKMFKFRSMRVLKEQKAGSEASLRPEKDRIFFVGHLIRKLKIDELPQLLNIIRGDMAIVGPRPVAKDQIDIFRVGRYDEAKKVRPGLTGPAALYDYIYGDKIEDPEEYERLVLPTRLELEAFYPAHMSMGYDIKMIWYTVVCVISSVFHKEPKKILAELTSAVVVETETAASETSVV